jgi:hypothetical protein
MGACYPEAVKRPLVKELPAIDLNDAPAPSSAEAPLAALDASAAS